MQKTNIVQLFRDLVWGVGRGSIAAGAITSGGGSSGKLNRVVEKMVARRSVRIHLDDLRINLAAADDFGSAELCVLPNRDIIIVSAKLHVGQNGSNADGGLLAFAGFASTAADQFTFAIGTAAASNATLSGAMIDVLQGVTPTNVQAGIGTINGFSNVSTTGKRIAAGASNKLYVNAANPVTAGTGTLSLTKGYVDIEYDDLDAI